MLCLPPLKISLFKTDFGTGRRAISSERKEGWKEMKASWIREVRHGL